MAKKNDALLEHEPVEPAEPDVPADPVEPAVREDSTRKGVRLAAIIVGGVIAAGALFGGGVLLGTSLPQGPGQFERGGFPGAPDGSGFPGGGPGPVMPGQGDGTRGDAPSGDGS